MNNRITRLILAVALSLILPLFLTSCKSGTTTSASPDALSPGQIDESMLDSFVKVQGKVLALMENPGGHGGAFIKLGDSKGEVGFRIEQEDWESYTDREKAGFSRDNTIIAEGMLVLSGQELVIVYMKAPLAAEGDQPPSADYALPMTTVDAYQVGWMTPVQVDDHIGDASRSKHGWIAGFPVVDNNDDILLYYGGYYRYWDADGFTDAKKWDAPHGGSHVIDHSNKLHLISTLEKHKNETVLWHVIWDGSRFSREVMFPGQFVEPSVWTSSLAIDQSGHLHLTFQDRSMGYVEVWYTSFDGETWSQPINLSQSHINSLAPTLAVGKDDEVYVAWHEEFQEPSVGQTAEVIFRYKDQNGWSEAIIAPMTATFIEVLADKRGSAYILAENQFVIWEGMQWDGPYEIEYPEYATAFYKRAVEDDGTLHFMWPRYHESIDQEKGDVIYKREVCYRKRTPEGNFGPVISLGIWSTAPTYEEIHNNIVVDSHGVVHAVFGGNMDGLLRLYYTNSGAPMQQLQLLAEDVLQPRLVTSTIINPPTVEIDALIDPNWRMDAILRIEQKEPLLRAAVDSFGQVHAVWQHWNGEKMDIHYSQFDGNSWSQSVSISDFEGPEINPVIAVDSLERVHVAWVRFAQGTSSIYWAYREGDEWSEPRKLSKKVTWSPYQGAMVQGVAMVQLNPTAENAIQPAIAAGPDGMLAMSWGHYPDDWGFIGSVATARFDGSKWLPETFPDDKTSRAFYADWSDVEVDSEGRIHLIFVHYGMMDEDSFLFMQPFHMLDDECKWSKNQPLLTIPNETNPYSQMVFRPFIKTTDSGQLFSVFSMRPFDRDSFPYRLDVEDSNAYITFWNGLDWSEPRRLDGGDAFGPSYVDIAMDADNTAHIMWAKYDTYSQRYSLYYTTSDGYQERDIIKLWQSESGLDPLPILKPEIAVEEDGTVHVVFSAQVDGAWQTYHFTKK